MRQFELNGTAIAIIKEGWLSVARNKLLSEIIDDQGYSEIKDDCRKSIESLVQFRKDGSDTKKEFFETSLSRL